LPVEEASRPSGREPKGRTHGGLRFFVVLGVLLVLYPLSIGPVCKLTEKGLLSIDYSVLYRPLGMLYDRSSVAKRFFDWYLDDLWGIK
jgi:hypothetical protein